MSDQSTSATRPEGIYVSYLVRQGLRLVAIKTNRTQGSSDEIADTVLTEWLASTHPDIHKHLTDRDNADKLFRESIRPRAPFDK